MICTYKGRFRRTPPTSGLVKSMSKDSNVISAEKLLSEAERTQIELLIEQLGLAPHPEGGYYNQVHRSAQFVQRESDSARRAGITVIYFLLPGAGQVSRWHRVSNSDETWHYAGGAPLELIRMTPDGSSTEALRLGPIDPSVSNQAPVHVIPAGWWQAAQSLGAYTLVNCCVGPGFDFEDFMLMKDIPDSSKPPIPEELLHYL